MSEDKAQAHWHAGNIFPPFSDDDTPHATLEDAKAHIVEHLMRAGNDLYEEASGEEAFTTAWDLRQMARECHDSIDLVREVDDLGDSWAAADLEWYIKPCSDEGCFDTPNDEEEER